MLRRFSKRNSWLAMLAIFEVILARCLQHLGAPMIYKTLHDIQSNWAIKIRVWFYFIKPCHGTLHYLSRVHLTHLFFDRHINMFCTKTVILMQYSFFYVYGIMKENWSNLIKISIIKYSFGCNAIKLKICNFGTNILLITFNIKRKNITKNWYKIIQYSN